MAASHNTLGAHVGTYECYLVRLGIGEVVAVGGVVMYMGDVVMYRRCYMCIKHGYLVENIDFRRLEKRLAMAARNMYSRVAITSQLFDEMVMRWR